MLVAFVGEFLFVFICLHVYLSICLFVEMRHPQRDNNQRAETQTAERQRDERQWVDCERGTKTATEGQKLRQRDKNTKMWS